MVRFHILTHPRGGIFWGDSYLSFWLWLRQFRLPPGVDLPGFVPGCGVFPVGPVPDPTFDEVVLFAKLDAIIASQSTHSLTTSVPEEHYEEYGDWGERFG